MKILLLLFSLFLITPASDPKVYSTQEFFYTENGRHLIVIEVNDSTYIEVPININVAPDTFYLNQKYKKI